MSSFFYRSSPRQNKDSTKMAIRRFHYPLLVFAFLSILVLQEAKTIDPYKVLGVDKNASQRDIQKAFHKLSLKYHPDKNKNKGAEERFAEINNAYEILSDEEKRKNYDLYGDEKGRPTYDAGSYGDHGGYTYFTNGGPGNNHFTSRPDGWQSMGGQGNSKSFSFSFGGDPTASGSSFNFGFNDIFSNFFGSGKKGGNQFGGFSNWGNSRSPSTSRIIQDVSYEFFKKEISDQGLTWLLLFYTPTKGYNMLESVIEEVANSLQGAIKVGGINCQKEQNLCKDLGVSPSKSARVFIYSYGTTERGSLLEYNGEWDGKSLKTFCQDHLPRFSRHVDLHQFDFSSTVENLPQVLLLSTRKDTPVIWRVLSGLYRKRFVFFDAEVHDVSDPVVRKLHVSALPAVVGRMSNGEVHVLRTGVVNDLKSGISELRTLLDSFEKKNKKAASSQGNRQSQNESQQKYKIPLLTGSNMDNLCSDNIVVCIIGIFRSSKAREKLESILHTVSQKTLMRQRNQLYNSRDSVSYSLLDATKQKAFLDAFDSSGFRSSDKLIVAFKPRKGKFAVFKDELTLEDVERFIGSVLNGDIQFMKVRQKPVVR